MKTKSLKDLSPTPPFFLDSISLLNSLPPVQRDCSQLTVCFCFSFLLTFFPCCSVESLPQRQSSTNFYLSPSHMRQFFMNCSNVGSLDGMQPFRNRLLQCRSPTGHKSFHQTFYREGFSSLHGIVHSTVFPWDHSLLWAHPPAPKLPPLQAAGPSAHSTLLLTSMQGHSYFTTVCTRSCSGMCSSAWTTSFLTFLTDPDRCRAVFLHIRIPLSSSTSCCTGIWVFPLETVSQMHIHVP